MRRTRIAKRPAHRRDEGDAMNEVLTPGPKRSRLREQLREVRDEIDALLDDMRKEV